MRPLLLAALLLAAITSATAQVSFIASSPKAARALADSLAATAAHHYRYSYTYTGLDTTKYGICYTSHWVDSSAYNWGVIRIHQASGIMSKHWRPEPATLTVTFTRHQGRYYYDCTKGRLNDLLPFWCRYVQPGASPAAIRTRGYAQATLHSGPDSLVLQLQEYNQWQLQRASYLH